MVLRGPADASTELRSGLDRGSGPSCERGGERSFCCSRPLFDAAARGAAIRHLACIGACGDHPGRLGSAHCLDGCGRVPCSFHYARSFTALGFTEYAAFIIVRRSAEWVIRSAFAVAGNSGRHTCGRSRRLGGEFHPTRAISGVSSIRTGVNVKLAGRTGWIDRKLRSREVVMIEGTRQGLTALSKTHLACHPMRVDSRLHQNDQLIISHY
jgi:hypothetical protein